MSRRPQQYSSTDLLAGTVLLDRNGHIKSYDEAWYRSARLLGISPQRSYINCRYSSLFKPFLSFRKDLDRALAKLNNGAYSSCDLAFPHVPAKLEMQVLSGAQNLILLRHVPNEESNSALAVTSQDLLGDNLSVAVLMADATGAVSYHNPAAEELFADALPFIAGQGTLPKGYVLFDQNDVPYGESPVLSMWRLQCNGELFISLNSPTVGKRWFKLTARVSQKPSLRKVPVIFQFTDVTQEKLVEHELFSAQIRLDLTSDCAKIGVWEWVPGTGQVIWNDRMYELFGEVDRSKSPQQVWHSVVHPEDRDYVDRELSSCLEQNADGHGDFRVTLPDGSIRHIRAHARPVRDLQNQSLRMVGVNWDVSSEVSTVRRLHSMVYEDSLTGLANRTTLMFRLNRAIARAMQSQGRVALLIMDLDNFKDINDNFGHLVGDSLLAALVARLRPIMRDRDTFARLAGDEFAVVMENLLETNEANILAQRLTDALHEPLKVEHHPPLEVQLSLGISFFPDDGKDATSIMKAADLAMYSAKRAGGNTTQTYAPVMSAELNRKLAMELMLREAARNSGFELYYQPIVDLSDSRVIACEALIRWQDGVGCFISPMDFIPVAEDCGLIIKIGDWVVENSFKQWLLWKTLDHSLSYISVNVSPHQLHEAGFAQCLIDMALSYGIAPREVQLEITEGTFLSEAKNTDTQLQLLIDAGFRLAIDDFGTGYSSLAYLKRIKVDVIKIDRSFVRDIEANKTDQEIVNAILAMTENLGYKTLVEGIEDEGQKELVLQMGCEFAQGFLFGRPTFPDEFAETYLKNQ